MSEVAAIKRRGRGLWQAYNDFCTQEAFVLECVQRHKGFTREQYAIIWHAIDTAWEAGYEQAMTDYGSQDSDK